LVAEDILSVKENEEHARKLMERRLDEAGNYRYNDAIGDAALQVSSFLLLWYHG